jgi:hypothetical protein
MPGGSSRWAQRWSSEANDEREPNPTLIATYLGLLVIRLELVTVPSFSELRKLLGVPSQETSRVQGRTHWHDTFKGDGAVRRSNTESAVVRGRVTNRAAAEEEEESVPAMLI